MQINTHVELHKSNVKVKFGKIAFFRKWENMIRIVVSLGAFKIARYTAKNLAILSACG